MRNPQYRAIAVAGLSVAAVVALSACSSDSSNSETTEPVTSAVAVAPANMPADPAAGLVGAGCAAYAEQVPTGPGSVAGMAQDPVTVAASNNPQLQTLTQALSGQLNPNVNLVETLNNGEFTVFAPTNDAFAKLPPQTIETLKTDSEMLTSILTYHVVPGQASPGQGARHAQDRSGRPGERHRLRRRAEGQRRRPGVRRRADRQRDRVHDRHGVDAPAELTAAERTARTRNPYAYGRFPSQDSARRPAAISGATAWSTRLPDAPAPASWSRKATPAAMIASLKYASAM